MVIVPISLLFYFNVFRDPDRSIGSHWSLVILASYLLGSIPFSYLLPKLKGRNVFVEGTKNIGATNVLVVAGPLIGALALVGDIAKGYLAVQLARLFQLNDWGIVLCALAAVAGHDFSVFLKFSGGKGVASTFGVILALDPVLSLIVFLSWWLVVLVTRYFILSTLLIMGALPFLMLLFSFRLEYFFFALLAFFLALYTHRDDIKKLLSGSELNVAQAVRHYLWR